MGENGHDNGEEIDQEGPEDVATPISTKKSESME